MNGATEATLQELLQVSKSMAAAISKLASQGGGSGGGGSSGIGSVASAALAPLSIAANGVKAAFGLLSDVVSGLAAVVGKLIGGVFSAVGGLIDFAAAAAKGQATLQTFYASFTKLPFFIGELMGVFSKIIGYAEGLLESYRNITKAGASFSGNLYEMARAASRSYMSMDQFANIINNNSEFFATMGGNVQKGVDTFVTLQNQMMGPGSKYSKALLGLGYTSEEVAQGLIDIMKSGVVMNKGQLQNNEKLFSSTAFYLGELDGLAKMTGKRRDQIAKEVEDAEQDQMWKTFMEGITDENQKAYVKAKLAEAGAVGGKGMMDVVKGSLMGLDTPISDAAKKLFVASGGFTASGLKLREGMDLAKTDLQRASRLAGTEIFEGARRAGSFFDQFDNMARAAGVGAKFQIDQAMNFKRIYNQFNGDYDKIRAHLNKAQADQAGGNAAALAKVQQDIKNFGSTIFGLASRVIEPVTGQLTKWGEIVVGWTADTVKKYMPQVQNFVEFMDKQIRPKLEAIAGWFGTQFSKLMKAKSPTEFFEILIGSAKEGFTNIWKEVKPVWDKEIKPVLISMWEGLIEAIKPYFITLTEEIIDTLNAWAFKAIGASEKFGIEDPEKRKQYRNVTRSYRDDFAEIESKRRDYELYKSSSKPEDQKLAKEARDRMQELIRVLVDDFNTPQIRAKYGSFIRENEEKLRQMQRYQYDTGTLGRHGKLFNDFGSGTPAVLHGNEAVVTPSQMDSLVNNNLAQGVERLNNLTAQLLMAQRESNDLARRTLSATKGLSTNLFA